MGSGDGVIFTVIIPTCFRSVEAVGKCLTALAGQTLSQDHFEIIMVDDGSQGKDTSGVQWILSEKFRNTLFLRQSSAGQGVARNLAMEKARGKLLLFLNDDAVSAPTLLEDHVRIHRENSAESVAVLGTFIVSPELPYSMFARMHSEHAYGIFEGQSEVGWRGFYTCNISVKKSFLEKYGTFDQHMRYYEDVELGERLSHHGLKVLYFPQIVAHHYHYLDEKNFMGYAPFHSRALVAWYKKAPHLKQELARYGFYPSEPFHRRAMHSLGDMIYNRWTNPVFLKIARNLSGSHEKMALALYKRVFVSLSRRTIKDELRKIP